MIRENVKPIFILCLSLQLWIWSSTDAIDPTRDWIEDWITAVECSKNGKKDKEALKAYTAAIRAQSLDQISKHLYLFNERGKLYLKIHDFDNAIHDFSTVLNCSDAHREELLDALWGRGQAYLAMGRRQEFEMDRKRLDQLEPFVTVLEENQDYQILKIGSHVRKEGKIEERLVKILLMQKKITSKEDVIFTPSSLVIVKK